MNSVDTRRRLLKGLQQRQRQHGAHISPDMGGRGSPGHSLRAGFVSECDRRGISTSAVRIVTGHQSDAMLSVYTRPRALFESSAGAYFNDRE